MSRIISIDEASVSDSTSFMDLTIDEKKEGGKGDPGSSNKFELPDLNKFSQPPKSTEVEANPLRGMAATHSISQIQSQIQHPLNVSNKPKIILDPKIQIIGNGNDNSILNHSMNGGVKNGDNLIKELVYPIKKFNPDHIEIISVPGDGNCLYSASSLALYGSINYHDSLRKYIQGYIYLNSNRYGSFINSTPHFYYIDNTTLKVWGGGLELDAIANIYGVRVNVFDFHTNTHYVIKPLKITENTKDISLGYCNGNHYDMVHYWDGVYHITIYDESDIGQIEGKSCTLDDNTFNKLKSIQNILIKSKMSIEELRKVDTLGLDQLKMALNNHLTSKLDTLVKLYSLTEPNYMNICNPIDKMEENALQKPKKKRGKYKQTKLKSTKKIIRYSLKKQQKMKKIKDFIREECGNDLNVDDSDCKSNMDIDSSNGSGQSTSNKSSKSTSNSKYLLTSKQVKTFLLAKRDLKRKGFMDGMCLTIYVYMFIYIIHIKNNTK